MLTEANIQCFLTLADTLSFTKTAQQLFMAQQSVSKHIARLEEELGFPLFVRNHHYVALTPAGERCRDLLARFQKEFGAAVKELRAQYGYLSRTLRVGYLEWLRLGDAPVRALEELRKDVPELELVTERYAYGPLNRQLLEGELDLVVTYESFAPEAQDLEKAALIETPMIILVSPSNPKAVEGARWTAFEGDTFLCAANETENAAETEKRARRDVERLGISGCPIQVAPNRESAFAAAEMGRGILLSTPLSLATQGYELKIFETDRMETLVCLWRKKAGNSAAEQYAKCLRRAYNT